jgi:hypothetical protein
MTAALVASCIAMEADFNLEKYGTCGTNSMCLHMSRFFGEAYNNKQYQLDSEVKSNYKGLVMSQYPGEKTDRFHIMSPCKTDLVVEGHDDDGTCKCEEYRDSDKVYFRMQKLACMISIVGVKKAIPLSEPGMCPEKIEGGGVVYDVEPVWYDIDTHEGDKIFTCDASGDVDQCIYDFMHEESCASDKYGDECLREEYRDCYHPTFGSQICDDDLLSFCDAEGVCWGCSPSPYFTIPLSTYQDSYPVEINYKEDVVDTENPYSQTREPVTTCTNSWSFDFFGRANEDDYYECITVKYDVESLRGYSVAGFGPNYCAENEDQFIDSVEGACFWGGIAGSVAVSALSGGITGTVIVPVAIGSGSVVCEKLVNMVGKWPHSQYE